MKLKNVPPQIIFLNCGTYPFDILFFINKEDEEVNKKLLKYFSQEDIDESLLISNIPRGRTAKINKRIVVRIWDYHVDCCDCYSILTHELFHAIHVLFDIIGLKYGKDSEEAFAYQLQYLTKQLLLKIKIST